MYPHNLPPAHRACPPRADGLGTTLKAKLGPCEAWLWVPVGDCLLRLILSGPDPWGGAETGPGGDALGVGMVTGLQSWAVPLGISCFNL